MKVRGLDLLFSCEQRGVYEVFGAPAAGKTEVLIAASVQALKAGNNVIFVDCMRRLNADRFSRYESFQREDLAKIAIFRPHSHLELVALLDDIAIHNLATNALVVIDDCFHFLVGTIEDTESMRGPGVLLSFLHEISTQSPFPVIFSTQARRYDNKIQPYLHSLTLPYINYLFETTRPKKNVVAIRQLPLLQLLEAEKYLDQAPDDVAFSQ